MVVLLEVMISTILCMHATIISCDPLKSSMKLIANELRYCLDSYQTLYLYKLKITAIVTIFYGW